MNRKDFEQEFGKMYCKNCKHDILKRDGGWYVHIRPKKTKLGNKFVHIIDIECSCGCIKPEPKEVV